MGDVLRAARWTIGVVLGLVFVYLLMVWVMGGLFGAALDDE